MDGAALDWLRVTGPNPFRELTRVECVVPERGGRLEITVHDASGRRVRTVASGWVAVGRRVHAWDGRNEGGRRVASGVYFLRGALDGRVAHRKLVRVR